MEQGDIKDTALEQVAESEPEVEAGLESKVAEKLANLKKPNASSEVSNGKVGATGAADEKAEVSAATIGRMLGLATASELGLMEGKLDLVSTRVSNLTVRMEKVLNILSGIPTGSDLERIDVQIGSLKSMIKEALSEVKEIGKDSIADAKIITNAPPQENAPSQEEAASEDESSESSEDQQTSSEEQ